MDWDERN